MDLLRRHANSGRALAAGAAGLFLGWAATAAALSALERNLPSGGMATHLGLVGAVGPGAAAKLRSFENCQEARDAGAAPILRGQPGYAKRLDRDHDGVACQ